MAGPRSSSEAPVRTFWLHKDNIVPRKNSILLRTTLQGCPLAGFLLMVNFMVNLKLNPSCCWRTPENVGGYLPTYQSAVSIFLGLCWACRGKVVGMNLMHRVHIAASGRIKCQTWRWSSHLVQISCLVCFACTDSPRVPLMNGNHRRLSADDVPVRGPTPLQLKSQAALIGLINAVVSVPTMISYGPIIFQACPVSIAGSLHSLPSTLCCIWSLQTSETYQTGCMHHYVCWILCVASCKIHLASCCSCSAHWCAEK